MVKEIILQWGYPRWDALYAGAACAWRALLVEVLWPWSKAGAGRSSSLWTDRPSDRMEMPFKSNPRQHY